MKRICLLLIVVLLIVGLSGWVCAESDTGYARLHPSNNSVEVTCSQLEEGQHYVFMALKGSGEASISGDSILEIRQFTSPSDTIQIALVGKQYKDAFFLFGGPFADGDSPKLIFLPQSMEAHFPASLTFIKDEAFMNCAFQMIYLSNGIASIGERAFKGCEQLSYIQIPSTVMWIADDAFEGCNNLVIGCQKNSLAYRYAQNAGIDYELMN